MYLQLVGLNMKQFAKNENLDLWVKIAIEDDAHYYFNLVEKTKEIFQADLKHSFAKYLVIENLIRVKNLTNGQI